MCKLDYNDHHIFRKIKGACRLPPTQLRNVMKISWFVLYTVADGCEYKLDALLSVANDQIVVNKSH